MPRTLCRACGKPTAYRRRVCVVCERDGRAAPPVVREGYHAAEPLPARPLLVEAPPPAPVAPALAGEILGREGAITYVRAGAWVYLVREGRARRFETVRTWPGSTTARRLAGEARGAVPGFEGWPPR